MTTRRIRKKCQALVSTLTLPRPFSVESLIHDLSSQRGRAIRLRGLPSGFAAHACGLVISTDTADEIYVEEKTTQFHREHIALHEIGHILMHHDNGGQESHGALAALLPNLSPEAISRFLARTSYTTEQEQEAELVASLIRATAGTLAPLPSTGVRGKLEVSLGIRE
ncbi:hypothetical protein ABZ746_22320 [Streptomyces sp. NPDC020096]